MKDSAHIVTTIEPTGRHDLLISPPDQHPSRCMQHLDSHTGNLAASDNIALLAGCKHAEGINNNTESQQPAEINNNTE